MTDNQHWLDRWEQDRTPFHETKVNPHLQAYISEFPLAPGSTVFLPLCGKSEDIFWLSQQGYNVVGSELSEIAIRAFFDEHKLSYQSFESNELTLHTSANIKLFQGDFFALEAIDIGDCALVYDRAALIAIEGPRRGDYCQKILSICPDSVKMLLVAFDYNQADMQGPPYAVLHEEVERHYAQAYDIDLVGQQDILDERPRWKQQGLNSLKESVYVLSNKKS